PEKRSDWLEKTSITAFLESHSYTTNEALKGTYRTTAQAFAAPSYLSSARSFKALLSYSGRLPEPSMWLLTASTAEAIFAPWLKHLAAMAQTFEIEAHPDFELGPHLEEAIRVPSAQHSRGKLR